MYVQLYQTYGYILKTHPFTRCRLTSVYRLWSSRTENNLQYFSRGPDIATDTTPQTRSALGDTMIRLLAVALSQKNPFFHSVETDWCYRLGSCRTENILQHFSRPGSSYRCHPPNTFRSGRAQPAKRERLGYPENLLGAKARCTGRQKGADCGPPPEQYPPDEHAEFRVPAP